ncbi:hypothetical protein [Microbispora sp. NPDC049125]|uniref:hypothetical protein n=1 Tax=Microbispora sp. NPDC049125 TaxID=3154929 RepID=UPI003465FE52
MIQPFQMSAVQALEGYWTGRGRGRIAAMAIERHVRRNAYHRSRAEIPDVVEGTFALTDVASRSRRNHRVGRMRKRANEVLDGYPPDPRLILPTSLGNVLRRAECTAGERYGLDTVVFYPRLYPHLSERLSTEMGAQLNVIDSSATFVFVFGAQTVLTSPLIARPDWWRLVPVGFAVAAYVAYRGACLAATRQAVLLLTAFDLHRFDMLRTLRRRLPLDGATELGDNKELSEFMRGYEPVPQDAAWRYVHWDVEPVVAEETPIAPEPEAEPMDSPEQTRPGPSRGLSAGGHAPDVPPPPGDGPPEVAPALPPPEEGR